MDIEKLIEQYRQAADKWEKRHPVTDTFDLRVQDALRDAATAISTLQAENEKLRVELQESEYDSVELRAELDQVKREGKIPRYTIGDTVYDCFGRAWEVTSVELHSMRTKNEWLYRCGHNGTDDYCALWHFEAFPSKEAALRREQDA